MSYEKEEKKKNKSNFLPYIIEYKNKIFEELKINWKRAKNFIDEYLLKRAKNDDAIVLYYKRKADLDRYITEYAKGNMKKQTTNLALKEYNEAIKRSLKLHVLNPVRLGLYLNYSKFLYNILDEHKKAIDIAKNK